MDTLPTIYTIIGVIWLYHTLSFFFVNRSTSLLSQFSACCWPVAIHRSLLDLTRSRWLHQECSAHHGNLRPAGNAMRTTCAMIDLFRIAEISICLDIEKHICIYIYYIYIYTIYIYIIYIYIQHMYMIGCKCMHVVFSFLQMETVEKQLWINTEGCWYFPGLLNWGTVPLYWQILTI